MSKNKNTNRYRIDTLEASMEKLAEYLDGLLERESKRDRAMGLTRAAPPVQLVPMFNNEDFIGYQVFVKDNLVAFVTPRGERAAFSDLVREAEQRTEEMGT